VELHSDEQETDALTNGTTFVIPGARFVVRGTGAGIDDACFRLAESPAPARCNTASKGTFMRTRLTGILALALVLGLLGTASAVPIPPPVLFDFNALAANVNSATGEDAIEDYMEALWGSDITVALGARTRKSRVESRPSGAYLGNSDGALNRGSCGDEVTCHPDPKDTFLINRWNAGSLDANLRDRIIITFEEEPIMGFEVDWEIFPVTQNGQNADITIKADGVTLFFRELLGADKELGDLGHFSFSFLAPVQTLEFIDWNDAPIGIDNLRVTRRRVPVPATTPLLAAGLLALGIIRRRRRS
jgi:hypothetical protein